jgi:L-ascorbate metabolism protein UlaG (beta-lactamase superfamily)
MIKNMKRLMKQVIEQEAAMEKGACRIHYIFHSGFAVETANHFMVFDYYKDFEKDLLSSEKIREKKGFIVFSSHGHDDHYNPEILDWSRYNPHIRYIFSSDIWPKIRERDLANISFMDPYEEKTVDDVSIKTYGSTDIGLSFRVRVDDLDIFHAGDLNWWHWKDESTEEEMEEAESWFKVEVERLKGEKLDIAFFPVDPRLGDGAHWGGEYFIQELKPTLFVPMHFGTEYGVTRDFAAKMEGRGVTCVTLNHTGQHFDFHK